MLPSEKELKEFEWAAKINQPNKARWWDGMLGINYAEEKRMQAVAEARNGMLIDCRTHIERD